MSKYTVFECLDCKSKAMYPSRTADGHMCGQCGSHLFIPIDEGNKAEMITKHRIKYPPAK